MATPKAFQLIPAAPKSRATRKAKAAPAVPAAAPEVAPQPVPQPAPAAQPKAQKRHKLRRSRGITVAPKAQARACKAGTKQAVLVDMLSRAGGASMAELREALGNWSDVTIRSGLTWDMANKGYGIRTTHEDGYQRFLATDYAGMGSFSADCHPDDLTAAEKADLLARNLANGYDPEEVFAVYHLVLPAGLTAPIPHDAKPDDVAAIKEWATANFGKSYGASALLGCFTDDELRAQFKDLAAAKRWAKVQSEARANTMEAAE